jgi:uncharacterized linocin/CFP29 family protein
MNGDLGRDQIWTPEIWAEIDKTVSAEVGRLRIAQKVFGGEPALGASNVPLDIVFPPPPAGSGSVREGVTIPFLEISVEFTLTQSQVANEATLRTGRTLAGVAANWMAFAEDALFFQGKDVNLPGNIRVANRELAANGLLGQATHPIVAVSPLSPNMYGDQTFRAVVEGINQLIHRNQPGPYALVLESSIYADAHRTSPGTSTTTADRIAALVQEGFYPAATLRNPLQVERAAQRVVNIPPPPAVGVDAMAELVALAAAANAAAAGGDPDVAARLRNRINNALAAVQAPAQPAQPPDPHDPPAPGEWGLLVSLGGERTKIYIGLEATTAFINRDNAGLYHFQVCERVQIVARDPRAIVALYFA